MTKEEIILKLVCSLNAGDSYYEDQRVNVAIEQYEKLVKKSIIVEESKTDELPTTDVSKLFRPPVGPL